MGDLSAHFSRREFACRDGSEHPIDPKLIDMLERLREHFGSPVVVTSGYRSPSYNARVGGAKKSRHCTGQAADIRVIGVTPREVYAWADKHLVGGVGLYERAPRGGWVHVDSRGYRARWKG